MNADEKICGKDTVRLSVIVPIYNVARYLGECLESIVRSCAWESAPAEAILIDDGSTDDSGVIAERFARKYPFIKIIHQKNAGVAAARNAGIRASSGQWLFFVDSDDYLADNAVSVLLKRVAQQEDADVLLFDAYKNQDGVQTVWEHFKEEKTITAPCELRSLQGEVLYYHGNPMAAPWDKVYKRSLLEKNGILFREELKVLDDMVFNAEIFGAAKKIAYYKDRIYHYRYVASSVTNRYRPDRVEQDRKVWAYLERYLSGLFSGERAGDDKAGAAPKEGEDREALWQAYYCRVVKSFGICCRLCFFHRENPKTFGEKIACLEEVCRSAPYQEAFRKVRPERLDWKLRILAYMARRSWGWGIYLLHLLENRVSLRGRRRRG